MRDLAKVFKDTQKLYSTNPVLAAACRNTAAAEKLYLAEDNVECSRNVFAEKCCVVVSKKRSFEAAAFYARNGMKTAVLNFANSFNPGGGVVHGARAQEECLCRCSTLYDSLVQKKMIADFYEKHCRDENEMATDDVIFSPAVKVFKSDTDCPELLAEDKWFDADVLTCAAPDLYVGWNDKIEIGDAELAAIHEKRLRRILDVAVANGDAVVVLGAFGCGAFGNPPEVVAAVAKKVLADYEHAFKTVEFAVYCSPRDSRNFEVFDKVIG